MEFKKSMYCTCVITKFLTSNFLTSIINNLYSLINLILLRRLFHSLVAVYFHNLRPCLVELALDNWAVIYYRFEDCSVLARPKRQGAAPYRFSVCPVVFQLSLRSGSWGNWGLGSWRTGGEGTLSFFKAG